MALWALSSVEDQDDLRGIPPTVRQAALLSSKEQKRHDDEVICGRYAFLDRQIAPLVRHSPDRKLTHRMDHILIHPIVGFLLFVLFMAGLFEAFFGGADPLIGVVETGFLHLEGLLKAHLPDSVFTHFLADGLLGGVGAVSDSNHGAPTGSVVGHAGHSPGFARPAYPSTPLLWPRCSRRPPWPTSSRRAVSC